MITVIKLMEQVYMLKDRAECCANLVLGKKRALLFDTGCGADNMLEAVRTVTNLPLLVIASHGHYDHIGGSYQFNKVYLTKEDHAILPYYNDDMLNMWVREMGLEKERGFIPFGFPAGSHLHTLNFDRFDLGELECSVIALAGHTKGSVGIWIPDFRLLLSGDALTPIMCLIFYHHLSKAVQLETLKRVQMLDFDYYLTSHHDRLLPKSLIPRMIACIERSNGRKHYEYQYPRPPYARGWFYLDSIEEEPIGIITEENDEKEV